MRRRSRRTTSGSSASSRLSPWFFAAIVLVGLNLRTVFASLPPLLTHVRDDLGLSAGVAGLLTTGPVLCFGAFAPLAPRLVRHVALERVVAACAALTAAGAAVRGVGGAAGLFAGTILAGAAIAVAQTLLPILIRSRHAARAGVLTGAFSMALTVGAAAAAGLAVPLEHALGGWRPALAAFGAVTAVAAVAWVAVTAQAPPTFVRREASLGLRRSGGSWSVAVYFGLQSAAFYAGLTWLPTILEHDGYSEAAAGGLQALANGVQFAPAFLLPIFAARRRDQSRLVLGIVAVAAAGIAGLLAAPAAALLWMTLIGLAQGASLGLALMLPVLRGRSAHAVASLTAMTLSVGYFIAAGAPFLLGLAHDLTGGWTAPLVLLLAITVAELVPGLRATRDWGVGA